MVLFTKLISWVLTFALFTKCFGHRDLYYFILICYIGYLICINLHEKNAVLIIAVLGIIIYLFPSLGVLWGYLALLMFHDKKNLQFVTLSLLLWLLELFHYPIVTVVMLTLLYFSTIVASYIVKIRLLNILILLGVILVTLIKLPYFAMPIYVEKYLPSIYAPSEVFCKVTRSKYIDSTSVKSPLIRSTSFKTQIPSSYPGIIIHDVDYEGMDPTISLQRWQQPVSWYDNLFLGNQYLLEGIINDGSLYSNIGITLKDTGQVILAYPTSFYNSQPLMLYLNKSLYLHDSDYSSSFLANYQSSTLNELMSNSLRPNLIRITNIIIILLLGYCMCYKVHKFSIFMMFLITNVVLVGSIFILPVNGDVRMEGRIVNSHENEKFNGSIKQIVASGYTYTIGDKNAKILIVQQRQKAKWKGEKIIIAEPYAKIEFKENLYEVNETPLGGTGCVIDARNWVRDGKFLPPYLLIDSVTFIATGSPASQQWKELLK